VRELWRQGYSPADVYRSNPELCGIIELLQNGAFSASDLEILRPLVEGLIWHDPYLVLADFESYVACQDRVSCAYVDVEQWARMSILNVARSGRFSSDRTIGEYCADIWHVQPVPVPLISRNDVEIGVFQQ